MDHPRSTTEGQVFAVLLGFTLVAFASRAYVRLALRLRREGGAVRAEGFAFADLLVCTVLLVFFGWLSFVAWLRPAPPPAAVSLQQIFENSLSLLIIVAAVAGFLWYRGGNLLELMGFRRLSAWRVLGWALLFFVALMPIVGVISVTVGLLKKGAEEQELVSFFKDRAAHGSYSGMATIFIAAVVLAPMIEEFLFRGFFYGVLKRYLGAVGSAFLTAGLFAALHANLASLAGLFVLALCLTLAYERTGSLFVPMCMHAFFNFSNLVLLYAQMQGWF